MSIYNKGIHAVRTDGMRSVCPKCDDLGLTREHFNELGVDWNLEPCRKHSRVGRQIPLRLKFQRVRQFTLNLT